MHIDVMSHKACISLLLNECESLKQLQQTHAHFITQGLVQQTQHLACLVLKNYTKFRRTQDAKTVFDQITNPDLVSWTSLMSSYLHNDHPTKALSIFTRMISADMKPDGFTIVGALSACARGTDLNRGKAVHGMIYRYGIYYDVIVHNSLIDLYCRNGRIETAELIFDKMGLKNVVTWTTLIHGCIKCKDLESAQQLFDKMPQRNSVSWTAIITGYIQGGNPIQALKLFREMRLAGEFLTGVTIVAVLSACADIGGLDFGKSIHGYINKTNLNPGLDIAVYNALIDMYSKSGNLEMAEMVFNGMMERDVYSWTTMISGLAIHGEGDRAIRIFSEMVRSGVKPNEITFLSVLTACSHEGQIDQGRKWFAEMKNSYGFEPKIEHYGCMVDLLGKAGLLGEAKQLIDEMGVEPDPVVWRSLLSACLVHGNIEFAEFTGRKIIELEPDNDGVYVLLCNMYATKNRWAKALETRKMMKERSVKKKPGCSWIEVNGVVHEFLVDEVMHHHIRGEIHSVIEGISKQMRNTDLNW